MPTRIPDTTHYVRATRLNEDAPYSTTGALRLGDKCFFFGYPPQAFGGQARFIPAVDEAGCPVAILLFRKHGKIPRAPGRYGKYRTAPHQPPPPTASLTAQQLDDMVQVYTALSHGQAPLVFSNAGERSYMEETHGVVAPTQRRRASASKVGIIVPLLGPTLSACLGLANPIMTERYPHEQERLRRLLPALLYEMATACLPLHQAGIAHLDLKFTNFARLRLSEQRPGGAVFAPLDFAGSRHILAPQQRADGTLGVSSYEQVTRDYAPSMASDVWSLGAQLASLANQVIRGAGGANPFAEPSPSRRRDLYLKYKTWYRNAGNIPADPLLAQRFSQYFDTLDAVNLDLGKLVREMMDPDFMSRPCLEEVRMRLNPLPDGALEELRQLTRETTPTEDGLGDLAPQVRTAIAGARASIPIMRTHFSPLRGTP